MSLLDAPPVTIEPHVTLLASDITEALHIVHQVGLPMVALHPGASDPRRRWPIEKFAAVGDALAEMIGAQVVICGDMGECELTQAVAQAMRRPALDLGGKLSLGGLAGLLARCRLLVANDSGPRHLAAAVGTRTVGIYWCGNMIMAGPPTHAKHRTVISWQTTCPECGVNLMDERRLVCGHSGSIVADIGVGDVLDAAAELLSEAGYVPIGASA